MSNFLKTFIKSHKKYNLSNRIPLFSGLYILFFVSTHFTIHSLGIISYELMEAGGEVFKVFWRNPTVTVISLIVATLHLGSVALKLAHRESLRMSGLEAARIITGLLIPFCLVPHVISTRILHEVQGIHDSYFSTIHMAWNALSVMISMAIIIVWAHGCLSLYLYVRLKPWYKKYAPLFFAFFILPPLFAGLGYAAAVRELDLLALNTAWLDEKIKQSGLSFEDFRPRTLAIADPVLAWYMGSLVFIFLYRKIRLEFLKRRRVIKISYFEGQEIMVYPGITILEASKSFKIPHVNICGGQGRCSTCRVRIDEGVEFLKTPEAAERQVLDRIAAPPNVRLACQTNVYRGMKLHPLLKHGIASTTDAHREVSYSQGKEKRIAIMFADLRGFTEFSEHRLPYDVVFVLNQYFQFMGQAIEANYGYLDKFIGDGIMALFGIETNIRKACRDSLLAAREMSAKLDELNRLLEHELESPLRMGIGIHAGMAIVGKMGYKKAAHITAIGDAVNTASRLEGVTREYDSQLVISRTLADYAHMTGDEFQSHEIQVKGRQNALEILSIDDARNITVSPFE